jgi:ferritin
MMPTTVKDLIAAQITHEYANALLYRSLANYFESISLPGLKGFMIKQYEGELDHAGRFIELLNDRMEIFAIESIPGPEFTPSSPLEAVTASFVREQETTALIKTITSIAYQNQDWLTVTALAWFLNEQIEEEKVTNDLMIRLRLAEGNSAALFEIDEQLME